MKKRLIALLSACAVTFMSVITPGVFVYADVFDEEAESDDFYEEAESDDFTEGDDATSDDEVNDFIEFTKEGREIIYWKENVREQGGFYEMCGDWLYYVDPEKYCLYAINMETEKKVKITNYPVANLNVYNNVLYCTDLSGSLIDIRLDPTSLTDVTLGGKLYKMEAADNPSKKSELVNIGEEGMAYYNLDFDQDGFFCLEGYEGLMGKDLEYAKLNENGEQIGSLSLAPEDEIVKSYEQDGYVYLEVDHIDPETGVNAGYILKFDRDNGTGSREFIFGENLQAYNGDINYISTEDNYLYQIPDGYADAKRISVTPVSTYNIDDGMILAISAAGNVAIAIAEEEELQPFAISTTAPAGGMTNYIEPVTRSDSMYEDIQKNADQVLKQISDTVDEQVSNAKHALEMAHVRAQVGDYDAFEEEWENEKVRQEAQEKAKFVGPSEDTGTTINSITTTPIDSAKGATKITDISTMPIDRSVSQNEDYSNYREKLIENKVAEVEKELEAVPEIKSELAEGRNKLADEKYGNPLPSLLNGWNEFDETQASAYQNIKFEEAVELARKQTIEEGYVDLLDPVLYEPLNKKKNTTTTGNGTGTGNGSVSETSNNAGEDANNSIIDPCSAVEVLLNDITSKSGITGAAEKYYNSEQISAYYAAYDKLFKDKRFDVSAYDLLEMNSLLQSRGITGMDADMVYDKLINKCKECLANCQYSTSLVEITPDNCKALVRVTVSNYLDFRGTDSQELFNEWAASAGYGMKYIYSTNTTAIISFLEFAIEHEIYNSPSSKSFDVVLYSDPVLGWVCDTSDTPGKCVTQIVYMPDAETYSGSLGSGGSDGESSASSESGGAPSASSAAGGAAIGESGGAPSASSESGGAPSESNVTGETANSDTSASSGLQEEPIQEEKKEHYDQSKQPDYSPDSSTENLLNVKLKKANGDEMEGYMNVPFSRPNAIRVTVVDREGIDQKNALDKFLNSLFGFKPDTFRKYSDISRGDKAIQDQERVVLDNSLPGKRPVEVVISNNIVVDEKPRPISDTLSDVKDSMINAVKNTYQELYSKVTGTPIYEEVYDPDYHCPPSYVDDRRLPLVPLPEKMRDERQADKIKALEEQMRKDIQKSIQKENERKKKEAAGEAIIDASEYFKQPQRRNQ